MKGDHSLRRATSAGRIDDGTMRLDAPPLPKRSRLQDFVATEQFTVRCRETRRAKDAELLGLSRLRAQRGFVRFRPRGF
jgi:hypothetical protein